MRKLLSNGLLVGAVLLGSPSMMHPEQQINGTVTYHQDPRYLRLKEYCVERDYPIEELAADFVAAADRYGLDWRLLPAISIIESSGGKFYHNNNILGWDSCRAHFSTIRVGIHHVAARLSMSKLYRDKDLDSILRTYNPYRSYSSRVKSVMRALGKADPGFVAAHN